MPWLISVVSLAAGSYLHWGVFQVSVTNLLLVLGTVALFVAALVVPFPHAPADRVVHTQGHRSDRSSEER